MDNSSTRSRRSSRRSNRRGFTLAELIVAMAVMGLIMGLVTPMVIGVRESVRSDQGRTGASQRVRDTSDLIGSDIRVAGERFAAGASLQLLPIEIVDGGDQPDEIVLRRNLWSGTLPICDNNVQGSKQSIHVVRNEAWLKTKKGKKHPECGQPVGDDGWPQNLSEVKALAEDIGDDGTLNGYIYDPAQEYGEFLSFKVKKNADKNGQIKRTTTTNLEHVYKLGDYALIYILSERRYRVEDGTLQLVVDGDEDGAMRVAPDITGLRARFMLEGGGTASTLPDGAGWQDIQGIEITVTASSVVNGEEREQTLTSRYFPRNILSH